MVQTTLKTVKAIKHHIHKFIEEQKADLQRIFDQTEIRLNTLRSVSGENLFEKSKGDSCVTEHNQ